MAKNYIIGTYKKPCGSLFTVTDEDYEVMREMTDREVHAAAVSDSDAQPLTREQLAKMKSVNPYAKK